MLKRAPKGEGWLLALLGIHPDEQIVGLNGAGRSHARPQSLGFVILVRARCSYARYPVPRKTETEEKLTVVDAGVA